MKALKQSFSKTENTGKMFIFVNYHMQSHAWLTYECSRTSVSCLNAPLHPPPPSKVSFYSSGGFLKCNARKVSLPCAEKGKMLVEPSHPLGTLISLGPHLLAQKGPSGPQNEIWVPALSETQEPLIRLPCVSVQFSCSVMSDSLRPHELQHTRPPCPSPTPGVHSDSWLSSQ